MKGAKTVAVIAQAMQSNMSEIQKMVTVAIVQGVAVDNQGKSKKINPALKIIIPIVVVAVIVGIWFFKANQEKQEVADISQETIDSSSPVTTTVESEETTAPGSSGTVTAEAQENVNADFLLAESEIDLERLKSYGLPIIIDFGADSCIPCKEMAPVLKKLNQEWQGKVIVKFADVWKYPDAAINFPLQVIPTQFFFDSTGNPYLPSDPEGMQMIMYSFNDNEQHIYTAHQGGMTEEQIRAVFTEMGIK